MVPVLLGRGSKQTFFLPSPVFLLHQIGLVDLLILYFLILVILLGGWGRGGVVAGVSGGAADVFCAVELVNAAGEQHAVAVQHHGAFGTSLSAQKGSVLLRETLQSKKIAHFQTAMNGVSRLQFFIKRYVFSMFIWKRGGSVLVSSSSSCCCGQSGP